MNEHTKLVKATTAGDLMAKVNVNPLAEVNSMWTTYDPQSEEDRPKIAKCFDDTDFRSEDMLNETFLLSHILCHACELVHPQTGEVADCVRVVMVSHDGTTIGCVSVGIFQSITRLAFVHGNPPWTQGIPVKLVQRSTKGGRKMLKLIDATNDKRGDD